MFVKHSEKIQSVRTVCKKKQNKIVNDDGENKNCRYGLNIEVKSTKIGLKETESNKA